MTIITGLSLTPCGVWRHGCRTIQNSRRLRAAFLMRSSLDSRHSPGEVAFAPSTPGSIGAQRDSGGVR
eukprot:CAMPEP_0168457224 /NCGR_PEP_ID=MMETSP0228-20121227/51718_1 /TAXON_ID=133427 /ORGANISM="Protoceratium reticulatum, Strain CCCM 535 (=CCMP 1889)" /LENGTH=67 /DNA_ID=CAMNT_0008472219 /DNA_START=351 /DNA_END=550 /DNA_ORIENTATION=+